MTQPRAPLPRYRLVRPQVGSAGKGGSDGLTLDPQQLAVVEHRAGPLLVVGGPGTGKTTALVEAVAARVAQGCDPAQILVLTYARRAAAALRDRIEARIGALRPTRATMAEPVVRTFPAYAFGLLRLAAAQRGEPAPRLLTGPEQDAVIRDLLTDPDAAKRWPPSLRKAIRTRAFAAELRDLLLRAAERGIGARTLAALGRRHERPDWVAAADFLAEYVRVLALRDASSGGSVAYDQAELVRSASALLSEEPQLLVTERGRTTFIYVDEFADTDPAQIDLLRLIGGGGAHLVAFADPDSSTFAFRGADPGAIRDFLHIFPTVDGRPAPRLDLSINYRGVPELVSATVRVANRLRGPAGHRRMVCAAGLSSAGFSSTGLSSTGATRGGAPAGLAALEVATLRTATSECAFVAQRLREAHLHHGIPWSRMAVIVRSLRHHQTALRRALTQAGIPVTTGAEDTALATQPAVAPLLLLLRCALDQSTLDEETAVTLLHSAYGGADPYTERRLRQQLRAVATAAGEPRPSGELLVAALGRQEALAMVDQRWAKPARAIATLMATARSSAARPGASAEDVLWAVWQASGLADRWSVASARGGRRGVTADRDLDAIMVLFDAAARFTDRLPGARIEAFLDHLLDQALPADTLAQTADRGEAVRMITAHAAKGLEWDLVAITGVQEGAWPDLRLRGSVLGSERLVDVDAGREPSAAAAVSALLDEERRLFYVAVSRARRSVVVTAIDPSSTGSGGEEQPSRFLAELAGGSSASRTQAGTVDAPSNLEPDEGGGVSAGVLRRPLTLPALVAELRMAVADLDRTIVERRIAAGQLARLAEAAVPGADPDQWWGLRPVSDERPLAGPGEQVTVSPSTVESVLRCGLRWLLERHGGGDPPSAKQSLGNLVHSAAMLAGQSAAEGNLDAAAVRRYVLDRFGQIELPALWLGERERGRAEAMVDKLLTWLAANPRHQVGVEVPFEQQLTGRSWGWPAEDAPAVRLRGRVDRLEQDAQGRLVVVDLKTGAAAPSAADTAVHPQLAAYQVAVAAGAFEQSNVPGGAEIVALGTTHNGPAVRAQEPLGEAADPGWATELVLRAADAMAASTFRAVINDSCPYCAVRSSCPLSGKGRQVTSG